MRNTKQEILKAGTSLFLKHSYQGTGINQVLKACNVPKGSFYHFFHSKEEFGLEVLESHVKRIVKMGKRYLENDQLPYIERFKSFYTDLLKPIEDSDFTTGCLAGSFGQEMAAISAPLREAVDAGLSQLRQLLRKFIIEGQNAGQINPALHAEEHAGYIVAAMQGSIIMAKVEKSNRPLDVFINISANMLSL